MQHIQFLRINRGIHKNFKSLKRSDNHDANLTKTQTETHLLNSVNKIPLYHLMILLSSSVTPFARYIDIIAADTQYSRGRPKTTMEALRWSTAKSLDPLIQKKVFESIRWTRREREREKETKRGWNERRRNENEETRKRRRKRERERVKEDSLLIVRVGVSLMFLVSCVRGHRTDSSVSPAFKLPLDGRAHFRAWLNIY